jgi:hypothetical protein
MSLPEMLHIGTSIHEAETPLPGRVAIDWSISGESVDCIRTGATLSVERRQRLQGLLLYDCACLTLKQAALLSHVAALKARKKMQE